MITAATALRSLVPYPTNQSTIPLSPVRGGGRGGTNKDVQLLENRRKIAGKPLANRLRPLVVLVRIPGRQGESS